MQGNTRRKLKKEYIPLLIALLVLIILILILVIVIFYDDKKGLIVPDPPKLEKVNIGVYDISSGKFNEKDLSSGDTAFVNVDYKIISDYYTNGIILTNPRVELVKDEIILSSQSKLDIPYISKIGLDGKLKWINKIEYSKYDYLVMADIIYADNYYYVIAEGEKTKSKDLVVLKFNKDTGQEEARSVIVEDMNNSVKEARKLDNGIAIVTYGSDNIIVYHLDTELKFKSNPYVLSEQKINAFYRAVPSVEGIASSGDTIAIALAYYLAENGSSYMLTIDFKNNTSKLEKFGELNNLDADYTGAIVGINDKFYTFQDIDLYSYDITGKKYNAYSYRDLKLENQKEYSQYADGNGDLLSETGEIYNAYMVYNMYESGLYLMVKGETIFNYVYDVFDWDFKLIKRYVINQFNYEYDEATILKRFYANGKLYEIYTYGGETASIMIAVIG